MGKRLIRIFDSEITEKIQSLVDIEINLILKNDVTLHGKITQADKLNIQFKDSIRRIHKIKLTEIAEIVLEKEADY